jgi:hypothetical protein
MNPDKMSKKPKKFELALNISFNFSLMVRGIKDIFNALSEKFKKLVMALLP